MVAFSPPYLWPSSRVYFVLMYASICLSLLSPVRAMILFILLYPGVSNGAWHLCASSLNEVFSFLEAGAGTTWATVWLVFESSKKMSDSGIYKTTQL